MVDTITAQNTKPLTYTYLQQASRNLQYIGYGPLLRLVLDIESPIERVFRLQKFIDTPGRPKEHITTANAIIKDLANGFIL